MVSSLFVYWAKRKEWNEVISFFMRQNCKDSLSLNVKSINDKEAKEKSENKIKGKNSTIK